MANSKTQTRPPEYANVRTGFRAGRTNAGFPWRTATTYRLFPENMSERQALLMKDDMEVATPKPVAEVEARKNIVRQARKLQEAGEIIMSAGDSSIMFGASS